MFIIIQIIARRASHNFKLNPAWCPLDSTVFLFRETGWRYCNRRPCLCLALGGARYSVNKVIALRKCNTEVRKLEAEPSPSLSPSSWCPLLWGPREVGTLTDRAPTPAEAVPCCVRLQCCRRGRGLLPRWGHHRQCAADRRRLDVRDRGAHR